MGVITDILLAVSLCADCFAVALCASVTMPDVRWREVMRIAVLFAVIHIISISIGWVFGAFIAGFIMGVVNYVGLLLLMYVGGSMIYEAFSDEEPRNLSGLRNIVLVGISVSIDALAVGGSMSMVGRSLPSMSVLMSVLFAVTVLSVIIGMKGGSFIGRKAGKPASVAGGIVLILIGINIPLGLL